jgi:hypothetical protein
LNFHACKTSNLASRSINSFTSFRQKCVQEIDDFNKNACANENVLISPGKNIKLKFFPLDPFMSTVLCMCEKL